MRLANAAITLLAVFSLTSPTAAQTPVTYTGPNGGNWSDPANWTGNNGMVPINGGGDTYAVTIPASKSVNFNLTGDDPEISSLTMESSSTLTLVNSSDGLTTLGSSVLRGTISATGVTFQATGPGNTFNGSAPRLFAINGGVAVIDTVLDTYTGSFNASQTIMEATGADGIGTGSLLDLQSLTQLTPTETFASGPTKT